MIDFSYKTTPRPCSYGLVSATVKFDARHGLTPYGYARGHQTFSVTGELFGTSRSRFCEHVRHERQTYWVHEVGACHDEIVEAFPELEPYVKWHLISADGPLHYMENAKFWLAYWRQLMGLTTHNLHSSNPREVGRFLPEYARKRFARVVVTDERDPLIAAGMDGILGWSEERASKWIEDRLPRLVADFTTDMKAVYELGRTLTVDLGVAADRDDDDRDDDDSYFVVSDAR